MILENNEFIRNIATQGPVFNTFGDMVIKYENCIFQDNVASFGGDLSAKPDQLRLRIYKVNEAFLYLDDIPIQNMIVHKDTVSFPMKIISLKFLGPDL